MVLSKNAAEDSIKGFASEGGHWYKQDGSPAYTIVGSNGKTRPTTLRDAKKYGLVPSVTTILRCASNPGLDRWKMNNLLMAAMTLPRIDGEGVDAFAERVIKDSQEQANKAMQLGTDIHGSLELAYSDKDFPIEHTDYVDSVQEAISSHFGAQQWASESSFASYRGYGGKIDLAAFNRTEKSVILDFKTKAFKEGDKVTPYDDHLMQLAAYGNGLEMAKFRAANVYVSTTEPGLVKIIEHDQDEIERAWEMFLSLLAFWKKKNKHG